MNLLVTAGLLLAVLTVHFAQGDDTIHFPKDEPEGTFQATFVKPSNVKPTATVNPVLRNKNCETSTKKEPQLVYDSDTDSWEEVVIKSSVKKCPEETNVSSINEERLKPAVQQARPMRCDPPKQILVYDSDTDSWEDTLWKNC